MKAIKTINLSATLRLLPVGESVKINLIEVPENSLRTRCSRMAKEYGCKFEIIRDYPNVIVSRTK